MRIARREFIKGTLAGGVAASLGSFPSYLFAQTGPIRPIVPGPRVERFKKAQHKLLLRYGVRAKSRYLKLAKPQLSVHVLEAGRGAAVVMIHGGGATAAQFAPLMRPLQNEYHLFAPDRPGCGLTDKIDYRGVPFREHAVDFLTSVLDGLRLPNASLVANSMGGYWALVFALANPARVSKLVLIGEPAGSSPPSAENRGPPPKPDAGPSLEGTRATYGGVLVANVARVSAEVLEEDLAGALLPGARLAWDTMLEEIGREKKGLTYALRPELKNLQAETLFIWGDKDRFGPPTLGQEMAALAPHARCEIVQDAGHLVWLDEPERCERLTLDFLRKKG